MLTKFQENILNVSENIAKSFRGYFFDSHCVLWNCYTTLRFDRRTTVCKAINAIVILGDILAHFLHIVEDRHVSSHAVSSKTPSSKILQS